jgi:hypothetical protein
MSCDVKRYNTIYNCGCQEDDSDSLVISCGLTGPANITIEKPKKMSVTIGLVWMNSVGYETALLIDADMNDLMTINDEYILVPTK